ncbi:Sir2 silent information regulator family NAD-dependent deacetylase [Deltaproteobacteria bacterium Smac51]|nr:Sir2 silent information regulator family NAD-dependent deacetylase [Deltaproteobacteria bacterium Smac51]
MDYQTRLKQAAEALAEAEIILVGAGAGLSSAAGLEYSGPRFTANFAPFIARYGFTDMYTAGFYPFKTQEEFWAYWARHISLNRFEPPAEPLYQELRKVIGTKDFFVITTNVDGQFLKAAFPDEKLFPVQGDYAYFQCAKACHDRTYYNEEQVKAMVANTHECRIPSGLVPVCPNCGGPMAVNIRKDQYFVQDKGWHEAQHRYQDTINLVLSRKAVLLEIGVGFNTPVIIRYPFEQIVFNNSQARLVRINRDYPEGSPDNIDRTLSFGENILEVISSLSETSQ